MSEIYLVGGEKKEIRGTKYDIFLMSNAERRVQNAEVMKAGD
jgi:hypothetical protein